MASTVDSHEWSELPGAQSAVPEAFLRTSLWVQNSVDPLAERAEHTLSVLEGLGWGILSQTLTLGFLHGGRRQGWGGLSSVPSVGAGSYVILGLSLVSLCLFQTEAIPTSE